MNANEIETFIFIHDQDILLKYEENNKFSKLNTYTYVFLGNKPTDKISMMSNVIFADQYSDNYENYPKMCAYSGWYILYKYNLITKKYVNLFEYDVVLSDDFNEKQLEIITDKNIYGYIPLDINNCFLNNSNWSGDLFKYYLKKYDININKNVIDYCNYYKIKLWSPTSNVTFSCDFFYYYMNNNLPVFDYLKISPNVGHNLERNLSVFCFLNDQKIEFIPNVLSHYQLDSHQTQGISSVNFSTNIENLSKNLTCSRK